MTPHTAVTTPAPTPHTARTTAEDIHPAARPLLDAIHALRDYRPTNGHDLAHLITTLVGVGDGGVCAATELAHTAARLVRDHVPASLPITDQAYALEATGYYAEAHAAHGEDLGNAAVHALEGTEHPAGTAADFYRDFGIPTGP